MNNIKAIAQLEDLKVDRLSFIHNNELDAVFLNDIKAINLAIKALKKCPDIKDNSFKCRMCGRELRTWKSIQRGFGEVCERKFLKDVYENQQIKIEEILRRGEKENGQ
ncbi:MAG TPA: DUF6011 domain-containing protein [Clostridiaceae bacterium]|jgi:hypothetical protein|nr:hypothetical protein [Clostridiales bacterium]HJJ09583.1 DUF6011 domain-containing protein [Clostridiaceae bacterium]